MRVRRGSSTAPTKCTRSPSPVKRSRDTRPSTAGRPSTCPPDAPPPSRSSPRSSTSNRPTADPHCWFLWYSIRIYTYRIPQERLRNGGSGGHVAAAVDHQCFAVEEAAGVRAQEEHHG